MLRTFALIALAWLALTLPAWAAKEDNVCVQAYLIETNFLAGTADGALGPKSQKAAADFLERAGLIGHLPPLSDETAAAWCAFLASEDGKAIAELAALTLYDVEPIEGLPEFDDGVGPVPVDFSKFKLTDKFDGLNCAFAMRATFQDGNGHTFASGNLTFENGGHATFTESKWEVGDYAAPEAFGRANLAITEKRQLVGRMPVFHLFVQEGDIPREPVIVTLGPDNGALSGDLPQGKLGFDINEADKGEMELRCQGAEGPVKIAFDFSDYKLTTEFAGYTCRATVMNVYGPGATDPSAHAEFKIDAKGKVNFVAGTWMTGGPPDSFKMANLAITRDRRLVGIMDIYFIFPDPDPSPPLTKEFDGTEGQFAEDLTGYAEFKPNPSPTLVQFQINSCLPPA